MSMFRVETPWINGDKIEMPLPEARHLALVLRKKTGDLIRCRDTEGRILSCRLLAVSPESVTAAIEAATMSADGNYPVSLVFPILKNQRSDWIVQKATELGVDHLVPFFFDRSVVRPNRDRHAARFVRIAHEACKQCERGRPPAVAPETDSFDELRAILDAQGPALRILPWEKGTAPLASVLRAADAPAARYVLAVGPEGGLAEDEVARFVSAGFVPVRLGRNILRSETAAIASLACLVYEVFDSEDRPG